MGGGEGGGEGSEGAGGFLRIVVLIFDITSGGEGGGGVTCEAGVVHV